MSIGFSIIITKIVYIIKLTNYNHVNNLIPKPPRPIFSDGRNGVRALKRKERSTAPQQSFDSLHHEERVHCPRLSQDPPNADTWYGN